MFQELVPLVKASDKVVITLSMQGDEMTVVVAPTVSKPDDAALVAPIALTATPAELDAEFANAIGGTGRVHEGGDSSGYRCSVEQGDQGPRDIQSRQSEVAGAQVERHGRRR